MTRVQRYSMSADRACSSVAPLLIGKALPPDQRALVERAFVSAFTHPVGEVQWYAVWGIARQLWSIDPALTIGCVNAIAYASQRSSTRDARWRPGSHTVAASRRRLLKLKLQP